MGLFDKVMDDWLGDPFGSYEAEAGAQRASAEGAEFAQQGIDEQRRQYDINRGILNPYVQAGYGAIGAPPQPIGFGSPIGGSYGTGEEVLMDQQPDGSYSRGPSPSARIKGSFGSPQGGPGTLGYYSGLGSQGMEGLSSLAGATAGGVGQLQQYAGAGTSALESQRALAGELGPEAQQAAMTEIENSPEMQMMVRQGEEALLQNASATGGLRGGNTQRALAELRPQMLNALVNQKYSRLGGLAGAGLNTSQYLTGAGGGVSQYMTGAGQQATGQIASMGQASAAGTAAMGQQSASSIANLLGQKGAAIAGGHMASGSGASGAMGGLLNIGSIGAGIYSGMKK